MSTYHHQSIRINYRDQGAGRPIVLIHGYGASLDTWRYLVDDLSPEFRVVRLDLKGHGYSARVHDSRYSLQDHTEVVTGLIEYLGLTDAVLAGHSFGSAIALNVALTEHRKASRQVSGLILIGACANPNQLPFFVRMWGMPVIGWLATKLLPIGLRTRLTLRRGFYDDQKVTDAQVELYTKYQSIPGTDYALMKTAQRFLDSFSDAMREELGRLQIPTLHILGEHDRIIARTAAVELCQLLPGCRLAIVNAAGHMPQEEAPREVLRLIEDFMRSKQR